MKLIEKLLDWFENLLWIQAIKDVSNSEYYFDKIERDSDIK